MYGIEIECRFKELPRNALIRIMLTDIVAVYPKGSTTLAVYETYEDAKRAERFMKGEV